MIARKYDINIIRKWLLNAKPTQYATTCAGENSCVAIILSIPSQSMDSNVLRTMCASNWTMR